MNRKVEQYIPIIQNVKEGITEILPNLVLKENPSILDVGCFGREGLNGSQAIMDKFYNKSNITAMSYYNQIPLYYPNINHLRGDYFSHKELGTFDLIYFDLGWSGQLKMIENELKTLMYKRLNDNGYLIFYMFNNNRYTTGRKKIQENLNNFWGTSNLNPPSIIKTLNNLNSKYKIKFINPETSRSIITWITLKK